MARGDVTVEPGGAGGRGALAAPLTLAIGATLVAAQIVGAGAPEGRARWTPLQRVPSASAPDTRNALDAAVERYVEPYVATNNFSGVVLVAQGGRPLVRRAYGHASRELGVANQVGTRFHIASVSKSFTAAAILLLQQQGRLDVHDGVGRFIHGYPNGDRLTLHHLLTHTSGIPNVNAFAEYDQRSRFPQTLPGIVSWFRDRPLEFDPGTRYSYSNSNYNLLALVIEQVSGQSYGAYLRQHILEPLGLDATGHDGDAEAVVLGMATGYAPEGLSGVRRAPFLDWSIKTGNGSLYSTADDLLRWTLAARTPGLFTAGTIEQAFAEHAKGIGYGWFIRGEERRSVALSGRSPGFAASVEHFLGEDVTVIVLGNLYTSIAQTMATDLAAIALGEHRAPLLPAAPISVPTSRLERCAGAYRFGSDFTFNPNLLVRVERDGGALRMVGTAGMGTSYLIPLADGSFLDRAYGGRVAFDTAGGTAAGALTWTFDRGFRALRVP